MLFRSYAGRLVTASLAWARDLGLPRVRAFAHPENLGSRRVLLRAGFVETRWVEEMERFLYEIAP